MNPCHHASGIAVLGLLSLLPLGTQAQEPSVWRFQASLYGYLPSVGGKTTFPGAGGGSQVEVDAGTILDKLKMTFMGTFEASNGRLGMFTDVLYVDLGDARDTTDAISIGGRGIPLGTSSHVALDLRSWVWTLAGTWTAVADPGLKLDVLAGTRMLDVKQQLDWRLTGNVGPLPVVDRAGTREVSAQNWDAIVGVKGRMALGESRWFAPVYVDLGAGESRFTWQAMAGVGYSFGWGELVGAWRYLDYRFKSGKPMEEVNFNGPAIAAVFRW